MSIESIIVGSILGIISFGFAISVLVVSILVARDGEKEIKKRVKRS